MDAGLLIFGALIWVVSSHIYGDLFNWKYGYDAAKAVGLGFLTLVLFGALIG